MSGFALGAGVILHRNGNGKALHKTYEATLAHYEMHLSIVKDREKVKEQANV